MPSSDEDVPLVASKPVKSEEKETSEAKDVSEDKEHVVIKKSEAEAEITKNKDEDEDKTSEEKVETKEKPDEKKVKPSKSSPKLESARIKLEKKILEKEDLEGDSENEAETPKSSRKERSRKSKSGDDDKGAKQSKEPEKKANSSKEKIGKIAKEEVDSGHEGTDEEDEEEKEENDVPANAGSYWNVDPSTKRQRKSLEHFHPEVAKTEIVVEEGEGEKFGDISGVRNRILEHVVSKKNKHDALRLLSRILFNRIPSPKAIKDNLLQFSGKNFKDKKDEETFRQGRIGKRTNAELKSMLEVLGLERSGKQQELASRLFAFLKKPGNDVVKGKASPSSGQKRKSSEGKSKPPPTKKRKSSKRKSKDDEDEEESDHEEEEEEPEEESEKEDKKDSKKAKHNPKKEKSPAKKVSKDKNEADQPKEKKKKGKELDCLPEEDDDDDLKKCIYSICSASDLSTLTLRMVRERLEGEHKVDVKTKKDLIRKYVDQYVASQ